MPFRAGDTVKHRPSGETWTLAAAHGNDVMPMGWPETFAKAEDCELVRAAEDWEHYKAVFEWLREHRSSSDRRTALNSETAVELGIAEYVQIPCHYCHGSGGVLHFHLNVEKAELLIAHPRPTTHNP